jgi:F-type H+-transporting ATPase subunit d
VQAAEKVLREFKAVDYDVSKWDQAVDSFQGKAVQAAKETVAKIETEEKSLKETLSNISEARPFEDLTVSDVLCCLVWCVAAIELLAGQVGRRSVGRVIMKNGDRVRDYHCCRAASDDQRRRRTV